MSNVPEVMSPDSMLPINFKSIIPLNIRFGPDEGVNMRAASPL